jgi:hypothetical protein
MSSLSVKAEHCFFFYYVRIIVLYFHIKGRIFFFLSSILLSFIFFFISFSVFNFFSLFLTFQYVQPIILPLVTTPIHVTPGISTASGIHRTFQLRPSMYLGMSGRRVYFAEAARIQRAIYNPLPGASPRVQNY